MIVVGELINGMYKDVGKAISNRESDVIQHLAAEQVAAGATRLDVNAGPYSKDPVEDMKWLVGTIAKAVDVSLSIDSTRLDVIEAGLMLAKLRPMINSTSADDDKLDAIFGLAKKYNAQVIGLTMDRTGVPDSKDKRLELALKIAAKASDHGIATEDLFLDPVLFPVKVSQPQISVVLDSIREFRLIGNPPPNVIVGLSNISQGAPKALRSAINRTFIAMAIASGLNAAIMDPLDADLMDSLIASEVLANRSIYCDSFLEAYRKR